MTLETLGTIVVLAVVVQIIWIIWFTTAIAEMRRSLRDLRHNSNATAFHIERLESADFAVLNSRRESCKSCGECEASAFDLSQRRPVAYVRRHGVPAHLCLQCAEKEHRTALRPWDRDRETAAVADLCKEADIEP